MTEFAETQWYFARRGQQLGPVPESTLRQMLATGELSSADGVWRQGFPEWVKAETVAGLMPVPTGPGNALPPPPPLPMGYPPQAAMPLGYAGPQPAYGPYGGPPSIGQDPGMRRLLPVGRSGWAIAAGYLGLFSVVPFFAPIALIISIVAIMDIKKHPERHGMGRAIFGLIMGILGSVGLLVMLIALGSR